MTVNLNRGVGVVNELFFSVFNMFRQLLLIENEKKSPILFVQLLMGNSLC